MESQPQNPEFKINPENFHTWSRLFFFNFSKPQMNSPAAV